MKKGPLSAALNKASIIGGAVPRASDGRNIDPALGVLQGEGSHQQVGLPGSSTQLRPSGPQPDSTAQAGSYYGLPLLQETVWKVGIPAYFYIGGVAGASAALAAAAQLYGGPSLSRLVSRGRTIALVGSVVSAGLLVEDLGRPSRFLAMLRVFRPTSPMSVGSWVLSAFGATAAASALFGARRGALGQAARASGVAAGALGLPLAGYTAVLLANTAVPAWQGARTALPPLFISSAMSAAASVLELFPLRPREETVIGRFGKAGKIAELAATFAVEAELGRSPQAVRPLRRGATSALWMAARACTAASLALSFVPGRARWKKLASGVLGTLGAVATRFAVFEAGRVSARDPHATFDQQRRLAPASAELAPA